MDESELTKRMHKSKIEAENNESVYRRFGMSSKGEGMSCGVVEMVKCSTLR